MTFKTNLIPHANNADELGSSSAGWKISKINAPTSSGGTTYGPGSAGQALLSNGSTLYWGQAGTNVTESTVANWGFSKTTGTVYSVTITEGTGITVNSTAAIVNTGSRTISLASGVISTTGTYGNNTQQTPAHGGTFNIPYITVDTYGRVTSAGTTTVKLPADNNTWNPLTTSQAGYVSKAPNSTAQFLRGDATWAALPSATSSIAGIVTLSNAVGTTVGSTASAGTGTAVARADHVHKGVTSVNSSAGAVILKKLTIGTKEYNGADDITINAEDLGLTGSMTFKGITTTNLSANSTVTTLSMKDGTTLTNPQTGWVVLDQNDNEEYIWSNNAWQSMGFASSYALKTHVHGNISNAGSLTSSAQTVLNHSMVIADTLGNIINSSIMFEDDTDSEAQYLSRNGSWGGIVSSSNAGLLDSNNYIALQNAIDSSIATSGDGITMTGSTNDFGTTSGVRTIKNTGVHSVTISDDYLVVNTNGTSANLTIPYATKAEQDAEGRVISSTYVLKSGDTMTGHLVIATSTPTLRVKDTGNNDLSAYLYVGSNHMDHGVYSNGYAPTSSTFTSGAGWIVRRGSDGQVHSSFKIYGAVWNDYAEYRKTLIPIEPGRVVQEGGDGALIPVNERLARGCEIVSDTFGFAIGQTEDCQTPIAASGRVLAYPYEPIEDFASHIGWPVCSGPEGTVSIMTEEEEEKYPSRIIGTISEIPTYKEWGSENIKVNGRVWIRIR